MCVACNMACDGVSFECPFSVEVTFLAFMVNVKERYVMRISPHTNVDFIRMILLQFVMASHFDTLLRLRVNGAAQTRRRETFHIYTGSRAECS
jgi:hypothetical protein